PNAAELAARIVEKVRVNPGNYVDKKKFEKFEYTDQEYQEELERIRERFTPLVNVCKEYGTAMRIGTNHGSLSDRIMNRFGDTPLGMVESALEFVRICEDLDYHSIVLSMKASNTQVMVQAYRLLIQKMEEEGMNYPIHLGVTEAGGGEDGRIKSAVGIGALLEDGIGDTIRVSLTEDPEYEVPVAISLANRYKYRQNHKPIKPVSEVPIDPITYKRRETSEVLGIGGSNVPVVVADFSSRLISTQKDLTDIGYKYDEPSDKWFLADAAADIIYLRKQNISFNLPENLKLIIDHDVWEKLDSKKLRYPLFSKSEYLNSKKFSDQLNFIELHLKDLDEVFSNKLKSDDKLVLVIKTDNEHGMAEQRRLFFKLIKRGIRNPVIVKRNYQNASLDEVRLYSSTDFGSLLLDGLGDGVWLNSKTNENTPETEGKRTLVKESKEKFINRTLFGILQATRTRISKTEYIACPSCGRTLFDLQETTEMIRKRTEHLKGVKIAIMGCIVNGPGEMADADYGYVGSGVDKITLYRNKDIVKRSVPSSEAVDELIGIIQEDGNWSEPSENAFS
ncbi:MAG: (E)-4-hydroxy-3-methylbut-2-enyl-diphosphate synthase, partial [Ignavibacteriaceae bacterium]|nr:(E)-4-hydroxy-3-methylbut-2-enyl-diphosphate synthase [Ignavibacteriaceae bacterium]